MLKDINYSIDTAEEKGLQICKWVSHMIYKCKYE